MINTVAGDATGATYVAGMTNSDDYPTRTGGYKQAYSNSNGDIFVTKSAPTEDFWTIQRISAESARIYPWE